jgi:hypothetical protein
MKLKLDSRGILLALTAVATVVAFTVVIWLGNIGREAIRDRSHRASVDGLALVHALGVNPTQNLHETPGKNIDSL